MVVGSSSTPAGSPGWGAVRNETLFTANSSVVIQHGWRAAQLWSSPALLQLNHEGSWLWNSMALRRDWSEVTLGCVPSPARQLCSAFMLQAPVFSGETSSAGSSVLETGRSVKASFCSVVCMRDPCVEVGARLCFLKFKLSWPPETLPSRYFFLSPHVRHLACEGHKGSWGRGEDRPAGKFSILANVSKSSIHQ